MRNMVGANKYTATHECIIAAAVATGSLMFFLLKNKVIDPSR